MRENTKINTARKRKRHNVQKPKRKENAKNKTKLTKKRQSENENPNEKKPHVHFFALLILEQWGSGANLMDEIKVNPVRFQGLNCIPYGVSILDSLHSLHRSGIVHADIRPVFVCLFFLLLFFVLFLFS
jgi:serine/threonine protein kinase